MIKQQDMWHIYTRSGPDGDWTWRMQSTNDKYLNGRGTEWARLKFINDFKVVQNTT